MLNAPNKGNLTMKRIAKFAIGAAMACGVALAAAAPAEAAPVHVGIGIGVPIGPAYYGYDYSAPCYDYYAPYCGYPPYYGPAYVSGYWDGYGGRAYGHFARGGFVDHGGYGHGSFAGHGRGGVAGPRSGGGHHH
jgi:hypothetical protein